MLRLVCISLCSGIVFATVGWAAGQQADELNARDAFWSAADLVGKRPSNVPPHRTIHKAAPSEEAAATPSNHGNGSVQVVDGESLQQGSAQKVSLHAPLGLRYSVLKRKDDGTFEEVPADAVFHAGDRIRLTVMSNQAGYLYIIEQGTSGKWRPLYPPAGDAEAKLTPGQEYLIPGGQNEFFQFSGNPGQEKLFVLLSREPETNLDQTIAALRSHQDGGGIDNQLVAQLRTQVQSRDLVFTKSDDNQQTGGNANGDNATYVVNKASNKTADPHIIVDVVLSHR